MMHVYPETHDWEVDVYYRCFVDLMSSRSVGFQNTDDSEKEYAYLAKLQWKQLFPHEHVVYLKTKNLWALWPPPPPPSEHDVKCQQEKSLPQVVQVTIYLFTILCLQFFFPTLSTLTHSDSFNWN